jgi:hypothetical protein
MTRDPRRDHSRPHPQPQPTKGVHHAHGAATPLPFPSARHAASHVHGQEAGRREHRIRRTYRAMAALCATLFPIAAVVGASLEDASAVTRVAVAWAIASLAGVAVCAYAAAVGAPSRTPRPARQPQSGRRGAVHPRWLPRR